MKKIKKIKPRSPAQLRYKERKPFFSEKEIIFRSQGRAKVLKISSRVQVILLSIFLLVGIWTGYSQRMYRLSGHIINNKNMEIAATKDAYIDLMGEFVALHKNVDSIDDKYKAAIVEDKIKEITEGNKLVSEEEVVERVNLNEALLQRDIAVSERDELKREVDKMEEVVDNIRNAELLVLDKISNVTNKELDKVKSTLSSVNDALKKKGLYFNALAKKKKSGQGGAYIPVKDKVKDKQINDKMSQIFEDVEDLEYYKEVMQYIPVGKPVWSYWLTSKFGGRSDPFKKTGAMHKGVDLAARTGNKIKVQAKGKVIQAEYSGAYGNVVTVDHGNGFKTKYAHMHKIYVKKGADVNINDTLGEVGNTGRSTGPHLHYEVLYQNQVVDPMFFIQAKIS